ncbi:hypothetical protein RJZ56_006047 [Blastomyces dermatitidis]|uniref:Uncharacterized protein n=3 Tax=Blastomyces TaxID=229219 RepID=A0A179V2Q8_BLAGS|nr:uncharacterized protein BDBG_08866 [Blastomyces gilchristii SLH14081]XP_045278687.1 uncharacterized protein BDCG_07464 [Blastomyces dermatitidis ER-3]EGE85432.1 hypothetical protein BDDG_08377 [Blastomyces dermatitidis ATCC 18188]EQL28248.1 hypothetical protein BDFG_08979 [Blastomyces dermatitidis ATCC 26199]EEQ92344.1 hypothetical protein BDCG_07464 [Blastomyces dermatitidis ER-3]OAT13718.1 hypothetical protein BDBG_08866 [Blastomyces gilchristii SLH14081]
MGNKVSAVTGVRSPNFFEPGNAVNEVWVGDLEVVSRLPFGDSDMAQAGWPKNDYPKIPWRPFIIPLRATVSAAVKSRSLFSIADPASDWSASLRDSAATKLVLICWVTMQILAIPVLMVPIALHLVPRNHFTAYGDDENEVQDPSIPSNDDAGSPDNSPRRKQDAAFARALLGSVFHVTGVLLVYGVHDGPVLSSILPPKPSLESTDSGISSPQDFARLDAATVYAAMSMALCLNSAYSVIRLWWGCYKFRRDHENEVREHNEKDAAMISAPPPYADGDDDDEDVVIVLV